MIEGPEVLLIEAFPGSLVDQITALFVAVAGRTVAFSVKLFPISKVLLDSLSVTLVTGVAAGGLTVTRQEASWFPSTVRTLIVVVPAASAVTVIEGPEVLLIEALLASVFDHVTFLLVAVAGRTVAFSVKLSPISKVLLDSLSVTLATGVVVARGVILNVYLLSLAGVPSEKLLL